MSSFSYDFSVLGGDARQVFLAEMLAESGRSLCHYALASQPNNCSSVSEHVSIVREAPSLEEACIHSGSVICPFPFTKNSADVSVENSIYRFSIQTLLHLLRPGQSLFAGGIPPSFKKEAAENNVAVFDYADDISLPVYNSISTAEGAICEAILHSPFNLHKSRCAVLGFGKCGHSIVYRLKGLSANVSVFTDNAEESARASVIADKSLSLKETQIGVAFTGSFCTYKKAFLELQKLSNCCGSVQTVFSTAAASTDSRFGSAESFYRRAEEITGNKPMMTISEAEPIGPKNLFDALVILPCTGNTLAKLANGITDTPALMAAKAHLRNNKPLLLSLSTNDALGMNMKNIGLLLNTKNIYFVPFGQDDPEKKPNSMTAHTDLLIPALEAALENRQLQPVIRDIVKK